MFLYLVGSDVGVAISSVLFLSGTFQLGARQSADVENQMVSVERILEYFRLPIENFTSGDANAQVGAPIEFTNVSVKYNDMEVLKNVSFKIKKGEKVGN
jgi:ABC-type multidrug transport system fused ATPase/permease subunit